MIRVVAALAALIPSAIAFADPLTEADVDRFMKVADAIEQIEDDTQSEIDFDLDRDNFLMFGDELIGRDGRLQLTEVLLDNVDASPGALAAFEDAVEDAGFRSMSEFADVSDRVLAAAIRSEVTADDLEELRALLDLNDQQLKFLPEEIRTIAAMAPKLVGAIDMVPDSDVALVEASGLLDD